MAKHVLNPQRKASDLKKWLPQNYDLLVKNQIVDIHEHLAQLQPALSLCLDSIATWEGVSAEVQLLEGNIEGWKTMQKSYLFRCWAKRIQFAFLDVGRGKKWANISDFALLLAHAIAVRDDEFSDFLGSRLVKALSEADKRVIGWEVDPFEPFMVRLYARWRNMSVTTRLSMAQSAIYESIFQRWSTTSSMEAALANACDYHLSRNVANAEVPEFVKPPYRYFPAEILAINRIRMEQGLESCLPDHPIMQTALARIPSSLPIVKDELLEQVIAKVRGELPIGDPW